MATNTAGEIRQICVESANERTQKSPRIRGVEIGGAVGNRTPDLYNAIVALSQLSYGPVFWANRARESAKFVAEDSGEFQGNASEKKVAQAN